MALKTYTGSCHCGAVKYQADLDISKGTLRCNCSLCKRARAWFAFVTPDHFRLEKGEDAMADYQWTPAGKPRPNLHYRFCKTCGVRAFATGQDPKGGQVYAIAVATLEGADPDELAKSVKYVDGGHDKFNQAPPEDSVSLRARPFLPFLTLPPLWEPISSQIAAIFILDVRQPYQ